MEYNTRDDTISFVQLYPNAASLAHGTSVFKDFFSLQIFSIVKGESEIYRIKGKYQLIIDQVSKI